MSELNLQVPIVGQPDKTEDAKVAADLAAIAAWANGGIDQTNLSATLNTFLNALMPTGVVVPFGGSVAPAGWLICDGAAVSRATYSRLFEVLGVAFGEGDKATTFNVPDLRERVPVGVGGAFTRGSKGGEATHKLTEGEIPPTQVQAIAEGGTPPNGFGGAVGFQVGGGAAYGIAVTNVGSFAWGLQAPGGGGAHNNIQPYTAISYMVRT